MRSLADQIARLGRPDLMRLPCLKIGAQVRVSVRRVKVAMATAYPYADEFALAYARIRAAAA